MQHRSCGVHHRLKFLWAFLSPVVCVSIFLFAETQVIAGAHAPSQILNPNPVALHIGTYLDPSRALDHHLAESDC